MKKWFHSIVNIYFCFQGAWIDDSYFILGTELFTGGNLHAFIRNTYKDGRRLSEPKCAELVYQLFDALRFIHDRNIAHRVNIQKEAIVQC